MYMKEIFKTVVFRNKVYENYEISNFGAVRSVDRNNAFVGANAVASYQTVQKLSGKVLKQKTNKDGYKYVGLSYHGKTLYVKIHRLVAEAFITNQHHYPAVNHLDEDKTNNRVDNLEWCTTRYNNKYGSRSEKMLGINVFKQDGTLYKTFDSLRLASEHLGISRRTIKKFCNNEKQLFRIGGKNTFFKDYTFIIKE